MMFPAFKEWHVVVEALLTGEQIIILRKGGISEGRGGFTPARATRFWLFPTHFHAQAEKTKPQAARFLQSDPVSGTVMLRAFADVAHHAFLSDWKAVARLDAFHCWTEETIRERFSWSKPPGIHAFIVRVHRLHDPILLPLTADMGGCKSWIEIPLSFSDHPATPVINDTAFQQRMITVGLQDQTPVAD
jgi:hypothetical protein